METKIIEAEHGEFSGNWGKFMIQRPTTEWKYRSRIDGNPLIRERGWGREHIIVLDLQTGEGAMLRHGGKASYDLNKRKVWVCPLFGPFLEWLYKQDISDFSALPEVVQLPHAPFALSGYRRPGPDEAIQLAADAMNLHVDRHNDVTRAAAQFLALGAALLSFGLDNDQAQYAFPMIDDEIVQSAVHSVAAVHERLRDAPAAITV